MNSGAPLRIVMLTTVRFHKAKGGTEKVMIDTANALAQRGYQVTILYNDKNGNDPGFPLSTSVTAINCSTEKTPILVSGLIRKVRAFSLFKEKYKKKLALLRLKKLASIFKRQILINPADIYITYDTKLSAMLVREFGIKGNIITTLQFNPEYIASLVDTKYLEPYIGEAGPIQLLKEEFVKSAKILFPHCKQFIIIPNAICPTFHQSNHCNKIIINIGRVCPQKNQQLLAEAFGIIHSTYKDWKVKIWGEYHLDKEYTNNLKKIISSYNMESQFELLGPTDNVYEKLQHASIFAFPSTFEGFGIALGEAMATGLPCIGLKNCPAVNTLVKDRENGLLCENTKEDLAKCLLLLMENQALRSQYGQKARNDISAYHPEKVWNLWEKAIQKLANR